MLVGAKNRFDWDMVRVIDVIHENLLGVFCDELLCSMCLSTRNRASKAHACFLPLKFLK